jgi:hypothetical protein
MYNRIKSNKFFHNIKIYINNEILKNLGANKFVN